MKKKIIITVIFILLICCNGVSSASSDVSDTALLEGFSISFYDGADSRIDYFGQKIENDELFYSYDYINSSLSISVNARSIDPQYDINVIINDEIYALFEIIPIPKDEFSIAIVLSVPEEATATIYTIDLTKSTPSDDADLSYVTYGALRNQAEPIQGELYDQEISTEETIIEVPYSSVSVVVIPFARHQMARIFIKQDSQWIQYEYADAVVISLEGKDRAAVEWQVKAEDWSVKDYEVTFVKKAESDNAELQSIKLGFFDTDGNIMGNEEVDLDHPTITLPRKARNYTINIIPVDYSSRVSISQNGVEIASKSMLNDGKKLMIEVTAESGKMKTYQIEIKSRTTIRRFLIPILVAIATLLLACSIFYFFYMMRRRTRAVP